MSEEKSHWIVQLFDKHSGSDIFIFCFFMMMIFSCCLGDVVKGIVQIVTAWKCGN